MGGYSETTCLCSSSCVALSVPFKYPAHVPPPEKGSTGLHRWCRGALQGAQVRRSLCRRATSGLAFGPHTASPPCWTSCVWPNAERNPTRLSTVAVAPSRLPPLPLLCVQHHCTTQPNATLARADLLNRLHLLAFIHLPLLSNHNHSSPRHLRSCLVLTVSQFPRSPSSLPLPFPPFSRHSRPGPHLDSPLPTLDIHARPVLVCPILTTAAGPELIRTRP